MRDCALAAAVLILQGCGGYYTKDVLYAPDTSAGWVNSSDINRSSKFECSGRSVRYVSPRVSSNKTAEGVFGIPVIPANEVIVKEDPAKNLRFTLEYEGLASPNCTMQDAMISIPGTGRVAPSFARGNHLTKSAYYCLLVFGIAERNVEAFSVHISSEKLGCEVSPLAVKRSTVNTYNYSPW